MSIPISIKITFCPREDHMIVAFLGECGQQCDKMFVHFSVKSFKCSDFLIEFFVVFLLELLDCEQSIGNIDLKGSTC